MNFLSDFRFEKVLEKYFCNSVIGYQKWSNRIHYLKHIFWAILGGVTDYRFLDNLLPYETVVEKGGVTGYRFLGNRLPCVCVWAVWVALQSVV